MIWQDACDSRVYCSQCPAVVSPDIDFIEFLKAKYSDFPDGGFDCPHGVVVELTVRRKGRACGSKCGNKQRRAEMARPIGKGSKEWFPDEKQQAVIDERADICRGCEKAAHSRVGLLLVTMRYNGWPIYGVKCNAAGCGKLKFLSDECPLNKWPENPLKTP